MSKATAPRGSRRLHRVLDQLDDFQTLARDRTLLELWRPKISKWAVGSHLEHLVLVNRGILKILEEAAPADQDVGQGPTLIGRWLLLAGYIPRGKARAPRFVAPREPHYDDLADDLREVRERFAALELERLSGAGILARHFAFGALDGPRWLRFVGIHQHHHAKIISDIRKSVA